MVQARIPMQIPDQFPLFPLTGAVLMPFGHLPLNIFEPRYLNMIDDALGNERMIGMIQPRKAKGDLVPDDAGLYEIGTLGRIIQFSDPGDGRYLITLEGMTRFRIKTIHAPDPNRGYRRAEADLTPYDHDLSPIEHDDGPGRDRLLDLMQSYFGNKDIEADWDAVSSAPYEALVASLAMSCPFVPEEKQALLECDSHADRAAMLISLFEMSTADLGAETGALKH